MGKMSIHYGLMGVNRRYRLLLSKRFARGKILEIGCSDGAFLSLFPREKIIGIDTDKERVKTAKKYGRAVVGSAVDFSLFPKQKFDTIVCNDVIEHINNKGKQSAENIELFFKNVDRLLNENGRLILSFPLKPFRNHPEFIADIPRFRNFKKVYKRYLPSNVSGFDNERDMPKIRKNPLTRSVLVVARPFIQLILLLKGRLMKDEIFLVYFKNEKQGF